MAQKKVCNGEVREWEPVWVEEHCCECGQVTSKRDSAEPPEHDFPREKREDGESYCMGCGAQFASYKLLDKMARESAQKWADAMHEASPVWDALHKGGW